MNIRDQNKKLNNHNYNISTKIKKLKKRLIGLEDLKTIWIIKDRIKKLEHKILINSQQVKFNLLILINERKVR